MSELVKTEQDFEDVLGSGKKIFVLFFASWCPYCSKFRPVFEKHAGDGSFYRLDSGGLESLEERYSIDVVPTVLCFKNGDVFSRLDGVPGKGLNEKQLVGFIKANER
jgi:thiol-disulfide isomerase/thioredoxin